MVMHCLSLIQLSMLRLLSLLVANTLNVKQGGVGGSAGDSHFCWLPFIFWAPVIHVIRLMIVLSEVTGASTLPEQKLLVPQCSFEVECPLLFLAFTCWSPMGVSAAAWASSSCRAWQGPCLVSYCPPWVAEVVVWNLKQYEVVMCEVIMSLFMCVVWH
jgi:hypothetical protein